MLICYSKPDKDVQKENKTDKLYKVVDTHTGESSDMSFNEMMEEDSKGNFVGNTLVLNAKGNVVYSTAVKNKKTLLDTLFDLHIMPNGMGRSNVDVITSRSGQARFYAVLGQIANALDRYYSYKNSENTEYKVYKALLNDCFILKDYTIPASDIVDGVYTTPNYIEVIDRDSITGSYPDVEVLILNDDLHYIDLFAGSVFPNLKEIRLGTSSYEVSMHPINATYGNLRTIILPDLTKIKDIDRYVKGIHATFENYVLDEFHLDYASEKNDICKLIDTGGRNYRAIAGIRKLYIDNKTDTYYNYYSGKKDVLEEMYFANPVKKLCGNSFEYPNLRVITNLFWKVDVGSFKILEDLSSIDKSFFDRRFVITESMYGNPYAGCRIHLGFCDSIPYDTKLQLYIPDKEVSRVSFSGIYSASRIESITILFNDFRYDRQLYLDRQIKKLPKIDLTPFSEVIIENNIFTGSSITDEDTYILEKATHIGNDAFRDCNLTRIKFNPNLDIIPKNAFRHNKNLEYIELGEKTKVEKDAFAECIKVTSNREDINVQLDEERTIAKELLKQHMRANAMSGGSYNLEVDESSNTLIFLGAISGRESEIDAMQVVRIPMYVTKIGRRSNYHNPDHVADLSRCHIEGLIIPDSVESICNLKLPRDIKYVKIGKGIKYIDSDSLNQLFKFCPRVEIPYGIEEIPSNTFYNTGRILSIKLPTTLKTIGYRAFYSIYNLKMIHIPPNCCIENEAFYECDSLSYVYIYKDCVVKKQAFRKCPNLKYAFVEDGTTLADNAFPRKTKIIWFHKDFNYMHMGDFLNKHIFITEDEKDYISEDAVNTNTYSRVAYRVWSWLSENAEELPEFGTTAKDLKRLLEIAEETITDRKQLQEMCLPPSYTTADEFISRITQYTTIAKEILG